MIGKRAAGLMFLLVLCLGLLGGCSLELALETDLTSGGSAVSVSADESNADGADASADRKADSLTIEDLVFTEIFANGALEHIFFGSINRQGNASGYHHEGMPDSPGHVVEGTRSEPDENEVYEAKVMVGDVKKVSNKGYSTFFPIDWSAQAVVDAINEAYTGREWVTGNVWSGMFEGMEIQFYLDDEEHIISAFPIYQE